MSTLTDSIRLADIYSPAFVPVQNDRAVARCHYHSIELDPVFPGAEIVEKLWRTLAPRESAARTQSDELAEERLNTITHGLGLLASAAAVAYLLMAVVATGDRLRMASCGVYGATLVLMYAASTSLHAARRP